MQSYGRFTSKSRIAHIKAGAREMDRRVAEVHMEDGVQRCIDGRLFLHTPQHDDPDFEQDIGACPGCEECAMTTPSARDTTPEEIALMAEPGPKETTT